MRSATGLGTQKGFVSFGRIGGIPIRIHPSWLAILALLTWGFATRYFPLQDPGASPGPYWAFGLVASFLILVSVLFHEIGHAVWAVRENVLVRNISLLMFGGATRIGRKPQTARADFGIAVAGPLASLGLAGIAAALGTLAAPGTAWHAVSMLLVATNLLLAVSNLIPAFPLDGGRALRALLWRLTGNQEAATRYALWLGLLCALASLGMGVVLATLGGPWLGLALIISGLYLLNIARTGLKQLRLQGLVAGVTVREVALVPCLAVPSAWSLNQVVVEHAPGEDPHCFLVTEGDNHKGLITSEAAESAVQHGGDNMPVSELMIPMGPASVTAADDDAWSVLERMVGNETDALMVAEQGRFLGLLTRENLWKHIRDYGQLVASN
jgi:Zn-dependent protease